MIQYIGPESTNQQYYCKIDFKVNMVPIWNSETKRVDEEEDCFDHKNKQNTTTQCVERRRRSMC